jgi:hypothetical protein
MMYNSSVLREHHFSWQVDLQSSPAALWPFVADTNRFNHDTGLPPVAQVSDAADVPAGMRRLSFTVLGQHMEWDEAPFEWVFPYRFSVARYYRRGPLAQMRVLVEMSERPSGGTGLHYQVWARPANLLGDLVIRVQIGVLSARRFMEIFHSYDALLQRGGSQYDLPGRRSLPPAVANACKRPALLQMSCRRPFMPAHLLETADEWRCSASVPTRWRMPEMPRQAALETFLRAGRSAPRPALGNALSLLACARGQPRQPEHVHRTTHCDFCNIDFGAISTARWRWSFAPARRCARSPTGCSSAWPGRSLGCIA